MNRTAQHAITIRVPYADTDQMGMVYYANYLVYFERGRTEWMRDKGLCYRDLERQGLYFPVMSCTCNYRSPARYDEDLTVCTRIDESGAASVTFAYEIFCGDRLVVTGSTRHPLVDRTFKPIRVPAPLRQLLDKAYDEENSDS